MHHGHFSFASGTKALQCAKNPRHGQSQPQLNNQPQIATMSMKAKSILTPTNGRQDRITEFIGNITPDGFSFHHIENYGRCYLQLREQKFAAAITSRPS
jgi:hypothetical protein